MIAWLKKRIRYYFGFSQTEANGVIVLSILIFFATLIPFGVKFYLHSRPLDKSYETMLDSLVSQINSQIIEDDSRSKIGFVQQKKLVPVYFNPNTISYDSLIDFGLDEVISRRIIKYRIKGGIFYKPEDLAKIYGLSDSSYMQLKPYIVIPGPIIEKSEKIEFVDKLKDYSIPGFDINLVDSVQLMKIRGIGKVLSSRIVRFRDKLGGFYSLDQLDEVYGIEPSALENLKESAFLSENTDRKMININAMDIGSMNMHPYIDYNHAKVIVAYREQHGKFSSIDDLVNIYIIDSTWVTRVKPYLEL